MRQRSFVLLPVLIIIVTLGVLGYIIYKNSKIISPSKKIAENVTAINVSTDVAETIEFNETIPSNWLNYTSKENGFSFKYPPEWYMYLLNDTKNELIVGLYPTRDDFETVQNCYLKSEYADKKSMQCLEFANNNFIVSFSQGIYDTNNPKRPLDNLIKQIWGDRKFEDFNFLGSHAKINISDNCHGDYSSCKKGTIFYHVYVDESNESMINIELTVSDDLDQFSSRILSSFSK